MPSHIIHVIAGQAALAAAGSIAETAIPAAFNIGCQGPDIFSHNRRTKPFSLAFSRLLHRHGYGRFCRILATNIRGTRAKALEEWFYGFVTHQTVDRILHPYIINRSFVSGQTGITGVSPAHFHAFLERILDVRVLEVREGRKVATFDTKALFRPDTADIALISEAVAEALIETYPEETANDKEIRQRTENAFTDTLYYYDIANPVITSLRVPAEQSKIQRFVEIGVAGVALLYPEELDDSVDWLNAGRSPWRHPVTGAVNRSSVIDLLETAIGEATLAIQAVKSVLEGFATPENLEAQIGNACLSIYGPDGKIGTVEYSEPFDIGKTMLEQAEKRRIWLSAAVG